MAYQIERARECRIGRVRVFLEDRPRDDVLPILDRLAKAVTVAGG